MKTIKNLKTGNMINCDGAQFKKLLKIQNTIGTIYFEKRSLAACDSKTRTKTKTSLPNENPEKKVKCSTNPKGTPPCKEGFTKKPNKKGEMCCYKESKEKEKKQQPRPKSVPKTTTSKKSSPPKNETTKNKCNEDLHKGIMSSDLELIKKAIANGANVNHVEENTKETPLFKAITTKIEIIDLLVKAGADVNARNKYDETVLHKACEYEDVELIMYLLGKEADVNAVDDQGKTPLLVALYGYIPDEEERLDIVRKFIEKGANVNVMDTIDKNTPLHLACDKGDNEIVKMLVENKADMKVKNGNGETPYDVAKIRGYKNIASFLSKHMKK
jgi:hypothetical protein